MNTKNGSDSGYIFTKGAGMFRSRDGKILQDSEVDIFTEELYKLFQDEEFKKKHNFTDESFGYIYKFVKLFHSRDKETKSNKIQKIFNNKILMKHYFRTTDRNLVDLTPYEKSIATKIRNTYVGVQTEKVEHSEYSKKKILKKIFRNYAVREKMKFNNGHSYNKALRNFTRKYGDLTTRYMRQINKRYHDFKNSKEAILFDEYKLKKKYGNQVDAEKLFKYLAATDMLNSSKEHFEWLEGIIDIINNIEQPKQELDMELDDNLIALCQHFVENELDKD